VKVVAIIQARMGSTRFPGKVLETIGRRTLLECCTQRVLQASSVDDVVIATSDLATDQPIADLARRKGWSVFRGSEADVLDRYHGAARAAEADIVVRITSDCPLVDPTILNTAIELYASSSPAVDYVSNVISPRTFPQGLDVEVFGLHTLERAWLEDQNPAWREHVTPYIYRHPDRFRLRGFWSDPDYAHHRWTVDTPDDLKLVRRIYEYFGNADFGWMDAMRAVESNPAWAELNRHVEQKIVQ
jgi:spore coat polysaccharide biosynthesis protein SpsF